MKLSSYCMYCLVKKQVERINDISDEEKKSQYMKEVLNIISDHSEKLSAPVIISKINLLHQKFFNSSYSFEENKSYYNKLMLEKESDLYNSICKTDDKLLTALKLARAGNYIDFGTVESVSDDKLQMLLDSSTEETINENEYREFLQDLKNAEELVYLTDNCGEIVLDKLLIKILQKMYPNLKVTVIVRGKPVLNDATMEDAQMVGLCELVDVIGNGTGVAGTHLEEIDESARKKIEAADLIISKGQGNFETLHGCGMNIYYLFLCKCEWFVSRFKLEKFKGVFINEKNIYNEMRI